MLFLEVHWFNVGLFQVQLVTNKLICFLIEVYLIDNAFNKIPPIYIWMMTIFYPIIRQHRCYIQLM